MTEAEFLQNGGIPANTLTNDENRIIESLIETAWLSGKFETVSAERTGALIQTALNYGADAPEAARLVRHFDAATQFVASMPDAQRQKIYEKVEQKFGPRPV